MKHQSNSAIDLATTHLNASVGQMLTGDQLRSALQDGTLAAIGQSQAAAVAAFMFVELEPVLIARCALEARSDLRRANDLYRDTLRANAPRSILWERAVEQLL